MPKKEHLVMLFSAALIIGTICLYYDKVVGSEQRKVKEGMGRRNAVTDVVLQLQFNNGLSMDFVLKPDQIKRLPTNGQSMQLTNIVIK